MHERIFIGDKGRSVFSAGDPRLGGRSRVVIIGHRYTVLNRRVVRGSPRAPERAAVCCRGWQLFVGVMADSLFSSDASKASEENKESAMTPVSYTHLTLPTIYSV